jgi:hypothetical protein
MAVLHKTKGESKMKEKKSTTKEAVKPDEYGALGKLDGKICSLAMDVLGRYLDRYAGEVLTEVLMHSDLLDRYRDLADSGKPDERRQDYVRNRMIGYIRNALEEDEYMFA